MKAALNRMDELTFTPDDIDLALEQYNEGEARPITLTPAERQRVWAQFYEDMGQGWAETMTGIILTVLAERSSTP